MRASTSTSGRNGSSGTCSSASSGASRTRRAAPTPCTRSAPTARTRRTTRASPSRSNADSGIYLRGTPKAQVNIWNWPVGSGEVYGYRTDDSMPPEVRAGVTPTTRADKSLGEWNTFVITMKGDRLTVELNGTTVLENARLPGVPEAGPLALQHHGGYNKKTDTWNAASSLVQFRDIYVREL
ncbi:MAG: DUF1080 domain-containing protein [Salinibacter sp.]